jgi:hypothetical protein
MKPYLMSFTILLIVATGLVGCGAQPAVVPPTSTGKVTDYASLLDALRGAGATVEPGDTLTDSVFSVAGRIIKVNGLDVQVYEYQDAAAAEAEAATVSPSGSMIGTSIVEWIAPTHFYRAGKLIVLYVGADEALTRTLEALLGPQFAGGDASFQPPATVEAPAAVR